MLFPFPFVFRALVAVAVVGVLTGCGNTVEFSRENRQSIRSAAVPPASHYPMGDEVVFYTFGQNMAGALGGVVGAVASAEAGKGSRKELEALLKSEGIDPGQIMASVFREELRKSGMLPVVEAGGDAAFSFTMKLTGLMIPHGMTTRLSPYLFVEGKLIRRDKKVLWEDRTFERDGSVKHGMDKYVADPALLRAAYESAATRIARRFIEDMQSSSD